MAYKIYKILIFINNLILFFLLKIFNYKFYNKVNNFENILVYRVGRVGDCAVSIPCLKAIKIKYPNSKLILLSSIKDINSPSFLDFQELLPYVDKFKFYNHGDKNLIKFVRQIRGYKIDLWINASQDLTNLYTEIRNILFAKFCGGKIIVGSSVTTIQFLVKYLRNIKSIPEKIRLLQILQSIKISHYDANNEYLFFNENNYLKLNKEIEFLDFNSKVLAIAPGANKKPNVWNINNFIDIISFWVDQNRHVILLGSFDEISLAKDIQLKIKSKYIHNYIGKLSISESSYLLSKSYALVSNDSGLMHIADLLNIKIYSIFSCRDLRNKWYPVGKNSKVYRSSSDCKCLPFNNLCKYDNYCINKIESLEIIEDLKE